MMTLEDQQFRKWMRRPTEFVASAWYLLASAGQYVISYAAALLAQLLEQLGFWINTDALNVSTSAFAQLTLFMLPTLVYLIGHDGVEQSMRLKRPHWEAPLLALLAAPFGVMASDKLSTWWMLLVDALGGQLHGSSVPIPTSLPGLWLSLILFALLPAICEELFFRGGLMGAWERRGTRQALIITSVLFALLHGSVLGLPVQLMMGFVLGSIVILSDSLLTGMVYHAAHNAVTLILSYLSCNTPEAAIDPYADIAGYVQLTGGFDALIIQTIVWGALYGGALALLIHSMKKRGGKIDQILEGDKEPMGWETFLVLLAGLLTVGVTFMSDFLTICGIL